MDFIVHRKQDTAGVVSTSRLLKDQMATGFLVEDQTDITLKPPKDILLGRLVALKDIQPGEPVLKGGYPIGVAQQEIKKGELIEQPTLKPTD